VPGQVSRLDEVFGHYAQQTGHLTPEEKPLKVAQFVQDIIVEFQTVSGENHQLHFESNFNEPIAADARLLRQIAANLISNAIKYSSKRGDVRVLLDAQDEQFTLSVQDHGIGISEADQDHLFTAFQRGKKYRENLGNRVGVGNCQTGGGSSWRNNPTRKSDRSRYYSDCNPTVYFPPSLRTETVTLDSSDYYSASFKRCHWDCNQFNRGCSPLHDSS